MANAVLITFAGYPFTPSSLCPDNGLANLAAVLQGAGHRARILDFGTVDNMRRLYPEQIARKAGPILQELAQAGPSPSASLMQELIAVNDQLEQHQARETQALAEEITREVVDLDPALVGLKLWNGDGFSGSVTIAETLRRRFPKGRLGIFAGGPHASWMGHRIFRRTQAFDAIVVGEGEDKILPLMDRALKGSGFAGMPGVTTSADDPAKPTNLVDLDEIPSALYSEDVYPSMQGDQKLKLIILDESRGCPYCCAFCTHPVESGTRLRTRSAKLIVDDMEQVVRSLGIHAFRFAGSSTPGPLMAQIAEEITRRELSVKYASFAHFASSSPDHFELMRKSGLVAMFFGLESGSPKLLRRSAGKPIKIEEIGGTVRAAQQAGIAVACSLIVPMPFETEETMQESLRVLQSLRPDSVLVQFPGLLPGTPWFLEPEKYGFEVDREQYLLENLDYKIKLLFPPAFWKALPYKLNGRNFKEFSALTGRFVAMVEQSGLVTGIPDDNILMAQLAGMEPRQFRDLARVWCLTGNVAAMEQFVQAHNRGATAV